MAMQFSLENIQKQINENKFHEFMQTQGNLKFQQIKLDLENVKIEQSPKGEKANKKNKWNSLVSSPSY